MISKIHIKVSEAFLSRFSIQKEMITKKEGWESFPQRLLGEKALVRSFYSRTMQTLLSSTLHASGRAGGGGGRGRTDEETHSGVQQFCERWFSSR